MIIIFLLKLLFQFPSEFAESYLAGPIILPSFESSVRDLISILMFYRLAAGRVIIPKYEILKITIRMFHLSVQIHDMLDYPSGFGDGYND